MEQLEVETPFTCNGARGRRVARRPTSRCCSCCASGWASSRSRTAARRRASAAVAPCSSTASRASRASRRSRGSRAGRSRRSKGSTPATRDRARRRVRRDRRIAVRVLHAGHRDARVGRTRSAISTARWPRTCAGARVGAPCTTRSRSTRRDAPRRGARSRCRGAARRVGGRRRAGGARRRAARRRALRRRHRAARRARSRSRCRPARRPSRSRRRAAQWVVGRRRWPRREPPRARCRAGARRSRSARRSSTRCRDCPAGGVRLATSWVEPAYLEPDASWCEPGGEPASPLRERRRVRRQARTRRRRARRASSPISSARPCASSTRAKTSCGSARSVRRSRRPRCGATVAIEIDGVVARGGAAAFEREWPSPYSCAVVARWREVDGRRARRSAPSCARAGLAEHAVLVEGALDAAGVDRATLTDDADACSTRACSCRRVRARARGCTSIPTTGALERVEVRVAAGDPLDEIVLRSYVIGAAHMALGWVLHRVAVGRSGDRRGARPHDPVVRHRARQGHAAGRRRGGRRRPRAARRIVRRGVRRGRGRGVERARPRRGRAAGYVPGSSTRVPRVGSGGRRCPSYPSPPRARRRSPGPYSPAVRAGDWLVLAGQVGLDPATGDDGRRRRRGAGAPGARQHRGGARRLRRVAHRRRQDHGVRHRHRRLRDGERGLRRGLRRPPARPLDRRRSPRSPPAPRSRSKPGPTSPTSNAPSDVQCAP